MSAYIEMSGTTTPKTMHNNITRRVKRLALYPGSWWLSLPTKILGTRLVKRPATHEIKCYFSSIPYIYTPVPLTEVYKSDSIKILYAVG